MTCLLLMISLAAQPAATQPATVPAAAGDVVASLPTREPVPIHAPADSATAAYLRYSNAILTGDVEAAVAEIAIETEFEERSVRAIVEKNIAIEKLIALQEQVKPGSFDEVSTMGVMPPAMLASMQDTEEVDGEISTTAIFPQTGERDDTYIMFERVDGAWKMQRGAVGLSEFVYEQIDEQVAQELERFTQRVIEEVIPPLVPRVKAGEFETGAQLHDAMHGRMEAMGLFGP